MKDYKNKPITEWTAEDFAADKADRQAAFAQMADAMAAEIAEANEPVNAE